MQIPIKKLFTNNVNTRYGAKIKYDVYVDVNNQELKFQAWQGNWNKDWNQGVMIEIPENTDPRWKKADYQGKTFFTLGAPPEAMQSYGGASTPQPQQAQQGPPVATQQQGLDPEQAFGPRVTELETKVAKLETEMSDFKFQKMETEIAKENDDIPVVENEEEVSLKDIPF